MTRADCRRARGVVLVVLLAATGCSAAPRFGDGAATDIDRRETAADSIVAPAIADSASTRGEPAAIREPAPSDGATPSRDRGESAVSVDLGGVERTRLASETRRDLADAERALAAARKSRIDTAAIERLKTVEGFIQKARAAYDANDIDGAARLAHKARLLALELAGERR